MVAANRPPPEPPDLNSVAVGEGEPASSVVAAEARPCRLDDLITAGAGIHSGAEDGAVAKGNVDNTEAEPAEVENDVNYGTESNAGVGDSAKEKRRRTVAGVDGAPTVTGGGIRAQGFCRVSPIVSKPPPFMASVTPRRRSPPFIVKPSILLAAVLPWDRSEERRSDEVLTRATASARGRTTENGGARHGEKAGRLDSYGGFHATAGGGFHGLLVSQASGNRRVPELAVVELIAHQGWERQKVGGDGISFLLQCEKENVGRMEQGSTRFGNPNSIELGPIRVLLQLGFGLLLGFDLNFEVQTKRKHEDFMLSDPPKLKMEIILGQQQLYS